MEKIETSIYFAEGIQSKPMTKVASHYIPGKAWVPVLMISEDAVDPLGGFDSYDVLGFVQSDEDAEALINENPHMLWDTPIAIQKVMVTVASVPSWKILYDEFNHCWTDEGRQWIATYDLSEELTTIDVDIFDQYIKHPVYVPVFKE